MRVAVIHNLLPGGARRRLSEQIGRFEADVVEVCPSTATPIRADAHVVKFRPIAPRVVRPLRVPLRYLDFIDLLGVWRRVAARISELGVDVVFANPCRFLQAPAALLSELPPSLYFCDEPRRVDAEPAAKASRNRATRGVYMLMYAAQRHVDRRGVARATRVVTNSSFSAEQIWRAYARRTEVVPMGVGEVFLTTQPKPPAHILSVGALIPSKGHDIVIDAAARTSRAWPVVIVAPRPDMNETARLRAVAERTGVQLDVRVGIPDRELAELYAAAQATVYMAEQEPFGLASLEAQAAGCPVIVAAEGGLPETLAHGRSGWAVPRTPDSVGAKLEDLARTDVRDAFASAARAHAGHASWSHSAGAVEAILERLRWQ